MRSARASGIAVVVACGVTVVLGVVLWIRGRNAKVGRRVPSRNEGRKDVGQDNEALQKERADRAGVRVEEESVRKEEALPIDDPRWIRVGRVKELYLYPLKSGRGKEIKQCTFTEYGMSLEDEGRFSLRDRMFLVYSEETGEFRTGRNYPTLLLVSLSAVGETRAKLEAVGMPDLVFELPKNTGKGATPVKCTMWWKEELECLDCGPEVAKWMSRFLTGTSSGLRLGYTLLKRRRVLDGVWNSFSEVYKTLRDEDTGLYTDLASYMVMTESSVNELNQKLDRPVPALQFRPNIVVTEPEAFAEDNWEWIRIGEKAVIRNVKPCTRCSMIGIDAQTGSVDRREPMKTLRSFRKQPDPRKNKVDGYAPLMGIYCGLYRNGEVEIGDDVFVHVPESNGLQSNKLE